MQGIASRLRQAYERAAAKFPDFIISRSTLRVEQPLSPNISQYTFQLKQGNSTTDGPLTVLLNQNDAFVVVALSLGIKKQNTTTTPPQYGNFQLFTYPDPQYFVGAPAGQATESAALLTMYNGKLSFKTGSLERVKQTDTSDYLMVPQGQVIKQASPAIGDTLAQYGGWDWESRGYIEQEATMLLDGQQNNEFQLTLGAGSLTAIDGSYTSAGAQTATSRNVAVLRVLGLLIANGAQDRKRWTDAWQG